MTSSPSSSSSFSSSSSELLLAGFFRLAGRAAFCLPGLATSCSLKFRHFFARAPPVICNSAPHTQPTGCISSRQCVWRHQTCKWMSTGRSEAVWQRCKQCVACVQLFVCHQAPSRMRSTNGRVQACKIASLWSTGLRAHLSLLCFLAAFSCALLCHVRLTRRVFLSLLWHSLQTATACSGHRLTPSRTCSPNCAAQRLCLLLRRCAFLAEL